MDANDLKLLIAKLAACAGTAFIQENARRVDDPDAVVTSASAGKELEPGLELVVTVELRET